MRLHPLVVPEPLWSLLASSSSCCCCGLNFCITAAQALPIRDGDNNVATVMRNVLNAFIKPGPLPGSEFVGEEKLWR